MLTVLEKKINELNFLHCVIETVHTLKCFASLV